MNLSKSFLRLKDFFSHSSVGQSAIEYLTTYGWMLLVVAIVGGSIFTTVQGQAQFETSGFEDGGISLVDSGITGNFYSMQLRNSEANQIEVRKITLTQGDTEVVKRPSETLPSAGESTFQMIGLSDSNSQNEVDIAVKYDSGSLDGLVAEGVVSGSIDLNPDQATPEGEWVFVDVSDVPQRTIDTSKMSDFYMMKYEASHRDATSSERGGSNVPTSQQGVPAWGDLEQQEAVTACKEGGYTLSSNKQWQAATMAEIGNMSTQPLGNTDQGSDENGDSGTVDPTYEGSDTAVLTGSGPASWANTIGIYDMNGNLWEWTSTVVGPSHPARLDAEAKISSWNSNGYPESVGSVNDSLGKDYYVSNNDGDRVLIRGGDMITGEDGGVFAMGPFDDTVTNRNYIGFRCALN